MSKTLNFVSPNIVKNLTFSWLFGQTQLWQALVFDIMDSFERYAYTASINIIISKYYP